MKQKWIAVCTIFLSTLAVWSGAANATDGHFLHGNGAVNSSMGGAGIATTLDTIGVISNNPAGLEGLPGFQLDVSFELFKPDRTLSSDFTAVGGGKGSTDSESGIAPIPAIGVSYKPKDSSVTYGLGILGVGGFGVDYPQDCNNPILAVQGPPGPCSGGFGALNSNYTLLKIIPAIATTIGSKIRVGVALNADYSTLSVSPFPGVAPGAGGYANAAQPAGAFGVGFQVGAQMDLTPQMTLGVAYTSPQWFEKFKWNVQNTGTGLAQRIRFRLDVPQEIGAGLAFKPNDMLLLAIDGKWITYGNTKGFNRVGFQNDASIAGFAWKNIFVVGIGTQVKVTPKLALRAGYNYSQSPIRDGETFYNVFAPAIVRHHATVGAGYQFGDHFGVNLAYYHAFKNSTTGPAISPGAPFSVFPAGPVAGTKVTSELSEDSFLAQMSWKF